MEKNTVQELLGQRVRNLRKTKGITQEELAGKCDLYIDFLKGIEKGKENPSLHHLGKMAEVLGVEMFDLFRNKREDRRPSMIRREIIGIIDKMGRKNRKNLQLILQIL
jgi:transcriptional regulator with XRE-family HTH domain